jgi:hypothetical protein
MTTYTLSYWVKGVETFEPNAQIFHAANGWTKVVKEFCAINDLAAMQHAKDTRWPENSLLHQIQLINRGQG